MDGPATDAAKFWCPGCEATYTENKSEEKEKHPQIHSEGQVLSVRKCLRCVITDLHQKGKGSTK